MQLMYHHLETTTENLFPTFTWVVKRLVGTSDHFEFLFMRDGQGKYVRTSFKREEDGSCRRFYEVVDAREVGQERTVEHLTFHDLRDCAIRAALTYLRHREGLAANAVYVNPGKTETIGPCLARQSFQPLFVPPNL